MSQISNPFHVCFQQHLTNVRSAHSLKHYPSTMLYRTTNPVVRSVGHHNIEDREDSSTSQRKFGSYKAVRRNIALESEHCERKYQTGTSLQRHVAKCHVTCSTNLFNTDAPLSKSAKSDLNVPNFGEDFQVHLAPNLLLNPSNHERKHCNTEPIASTSTSHHADKLSATTQ